MYNVVHFYRRGGDSTYYIFVGGGITNTHDKEVTTLAASMSSCPAGNKYGALLVMYDDTINKMKHVDHFLHINILIVYSSFSLSL
jgi:hypothetical protein